VPVFNLMEDAATAEISRSQIWQWIRSPKGVLEDGRKVTKELVRKLLPEELARVRALLGADGWAAGRYDDAAKLFDQLITSDEYVEFLTLPATRPDPHITKRWPRSIRSKHCCRVQGVNCTHRH
jgi:malate synthase